jgi:hypothetical protein
VADGVDPGLQQPGHAAGAADVEDVEGDGDRRGAALPGAALADAAGRGEERAEPAVQDGQAFEADAGVLGAADTKHAVFKRALAE